jgi:hypothetical protein
VSCQRLQGISDVYFRTAHDTEVYVWEAQVNKLSHDHEDLFPWRRVSGQIRALIERIHNNIQFSLARKFEHILQAFQEHFLARFSGTITMGRILGGDDLREFVRLVTELDEERRQQAARILLGRIPEIKVKNGHGG